MKVIRRYEFEQWSVIFLSVKDYTILMNPDTSAFLGFYLPLCGVTKNIYRKSVKEKCKDILKNKLKNVIIRPTNKELVLILG